MVAVQSPTSPLVGAVVPSQVNASHVADVSVPSMLHVDGPLISKNALHVGWQLVPAVMLAWQFPTSPSCGAVETSQVIASQHVAEN
jgi:hypothetical protein